VRADGVAGAGNEEALARVRETGQGEGTVPRRSQSSTPISQPVMGLFVGARVM